MVMRHDIVEIKSPVIDQNGYLVADAFPTRVGVLKYVKSDGSITRELRHPDDVFDPASLATLCNRPIVDEHPDGGPMDSGNTKRLSVGHVGEQVEKSGAHVKANVVITDQAMIDKMMGRGRQAKRELSCGYTADTIEEKGIFEGEKYDSRQTKIVYNHLASVDRGRAGPTARIHLDADDAISEELGLEIEFNKETVMYERNDAQSSKLGDRLTALRDEKDLSTQDLATAAGIDESTMQQILGGSIDRPPDHRLKGLAKVLGVSFNSLLNLIPRDRRNEEKNDSTNEENRMSILIRRQAVSIGDYRQDAFEVMVDSDSEQAINTVLRKLDEANAQAQSMQDKYDAEKSGHTKTKAEKDQMDEDAKKKHDGPDPLELRKLAAEYADVLGVAAHMGIKDINDTASIESIKALVVQQHNPDFKTDGADPMIIEGRYGIICDGIMKELKAGQSLAALGSITTGDPKLDKVDTGNDPSPRQQYKQDMQGLHLLTDAQIKERWAKSSEQN